MHQHTLDNTILLSLAGQGDQPLVWVVVVGFEHARHPPWSCLDILRYFIGHEALNADAADGHMDDTNADILGQ